MSLQSFRRTFPRLWPIPGQHITSQTARFSQDRYKFCQRCFEKAFPRSFRSLLRTAQRAFARAEPTKPAAGSVHRSRSAGALLPPRLSAAPALPARRGRALPAPLHRGWLRRRPRGPGPPRAAPRRHGPRALPQAAPWGPRVRCRGGAQRVVSPSPTHVSAVTSDPNPREGCHGAPAPSTARHRSERRSAGGARWQRERSRGPRARRNSPTCGTPFSATPQFVLK